MANVFDKVITLDEAIDHIENGMSIMIGGFLGVGAPLKLIDKLVESGKKDLTLITTVCSYPGGGFDLGKLVENHQVRKIISSHTGTTPAIRKLYLSGELELEWFPMGTLAEKIRCGGGGLGGVLTPVGVGTLVEKGKEKTQVNGKEYLLETPLRADVALIDGFRADKMGNIEYRMTGITMNPIMAMAADYVIAEVNEIVETGQVDPNRVGTPLIYVNSVVQGYTLDEREKVFDDLWVRDHKIS
ncbi:CoA transferase subunit A [Cytobacillus sp. Hz8]|uniref:CoA transferase subunit A n=1 Tax=Cytobacillus sp. Hz8 TaxID=3347168 RepID=UPI0035DED8C1